MKRILLSVLTLGTVSVVAFAATGAFFSDSETSVDNTFVAGDIDLKIDNESYAIDFNIPEEDLPDDYTPVGALIASSHTSWELMDLENGEKKFFDFVDLKPGDYGEDTISIHVGSNDAWMCAAARITADEDVTCTDPELADDLSCNVDPNVDDGELDEELNFVFWVDDGDNVLEDNEVDSIFLEGPLSGIGQAGKITLADANNSVLGADPSVPIPGNNGNEADFFIGKAWCFGELTADQSTAKPQAEIDVVDNVEVPRSPLTGTGVTCDGSNASNQAQTDRVQGDLQFYAVQARNNPNFSCNNWNPSWVN